MILNSFIHQQLADAHRRELLNVAERTRLAAPTDAPVPSCWACTDQTRAAERPLTPRTPTPVRFY
jgi:hypothetical protein